MTLQRLCSELWERHKSSWHWHLATITNIPDDKNLQSLCVIDNPPPENVTKYKLMERFKIPSNENYKLCWCKFGNASHEIKPGN